MRCDHSDIPMSIAFLLELSDDDLTSKWGFGDFTTASDIRNELTHMLNKGLNTIIYQRKINI